MVRHPTKSLKQAAIFLVRESKTTDSFMTLDGRRLGRGVSGDLRNGRVLQLSKIIPLFVQDTPLRFLVQTTNPFPDREHASTSVNGTAILAAQKAIFPNQLLLTANNPHGTVKKTKKFPDQKR